MGKRGPKPRPVETLRLIGSKEQYNRKGEVAVIDGRPVAPDWMPDSALPHWEFWCELTRNQGIESPAWYVGLAQWCVAIVEWEDLEQRCIAARSSGNATVETEKGSVVANPLFGLRDKAWERVFKLGKEFGYTPSSKTSIRLDSGNEDQGLDRFFA